MRSLLTLATVVGLFLNLGCTIPLGPKSSDDKTPAQPSAPPPPPPSFPNHGAMP
jgi:hypothetical protein